MSRPFDCESSVPSATVCHFPALPRSASTGQAHPPPRSRINSAGIQCFLADENTIRMDWLWSNLLGGIKFCVRKVDADAASSLLAQNVPRALDVEGIGEYRQPRCPTSLEVSFQGLDKPVDYTRSLIGGPPSSQFWECDSCGHQWPKSTEKPSAEFLVQHPLSCSW
jgi:hypothetical protein